MDKRFNSTLIASSALLLGGAAVAQEPQQSQAPEQSTPATSSAQATSSAPDATQTGAATTTGAQKRTRTAQAPSQQTQASSAQSSSAQSRSTTDQRATGESSSSQSIRQARASGAPHPVMMMVLVPVALEKQTDNTLANGCWAKLYGGKDYTGDSFTMVGPLDLADMVGPFGVDWDDKVSSIKAGPKATITLYDNENYRDKSAKIAAGQQVPHLTEKLGFLEEVESMRINCGASGASG